MQKIQPPAQRSILVRNGKWDTAETVSELGIYGTYLRRGTAELMNKEVSVRTKVDKTEYRSRSIIYCLI